MPTQLRSWLRFLEFDRTVLFGIITKLWMVGSGPITVLLILKFFTEEVQGFHYTFASLLAFRNVVELGMTTVVLQFTTHEYAQLALDDKGGLTGDPCALSRLVSLGRIALKWFAVGGLILSVLCILAGHWFFSLEASDVHWQAPWIAISCCAGLLFVLTPVWALLEGCNQVRSVFTFRLFDSIFSRLAMWLVIAIGGGLWAAVSLTASSVVVATIYLLLKQRHFIATFFRHTPTESINWKTEMLPMQWRMAGSCICGYFIFSFINLLAFYYFGAEFAGRLGLTLSLLYSLGAVSVTWLQAKTPLFGIMVAQERHEELNKMTKKLTAIFTAICGPLVAFFVVGIFCAYHFELPYHQRFLMPFPTLIFGIVVFLDSIFEIMGVYARAHKEEPYMLLSFVQMLLVVTGAVVLGRVAGGTGLAASYLATRLLVSPWEFRIFWRYWIRHR